MSVRPTISARPPVLPYHHFTLDDIVVQLAADRVHARGIRGEGVRVALCDTGLYASHPWFGSRGLGARVQLAPGAVDPHRDPYGHGTASAADLLAIAPACALTVIKMPMRDGEFVSPVAALHVALALDVDIVVCGWALDAETTLTPYQKVLAWQLERLAAQGKLVVAPSGDYQWRRPGPGLYGFPAQHPDVLAVGGVFVDASGGLSASDYASGFTSTIYPGRVVPDVCGICGLLPRGALILHPVEPGCVMDRMAADGDPRGYPHSDGTAADDGWVCSSGTSAACPQVAGVCALMLAACPGLTPAQVRRLLLASARDVTTGACNPNTRDDGRINRAGPGFDVATGAGLVDAAAAVAAARDLAGAR